MNTLKTPGPSRWAHWLRVVLANTSARDGDWLLVIWRPYLTEVAIYQPATAGGGVSEVGLFSPHLPDSKRGKWPVSQVKEHALELFEEIKVERDLCHRRRIVRRPSSLL